MATEKPRILLRLDYADAAQAYLRSLPPEHFMEAVPQATQRKITVESLDLVHANRSDVQVFNELLVQYPHGRQQKIRQVVPDNMVVVHPEPIDADGSYDVLFQPARPFWVLEYVSPSSRRKDYDDSFRKYERELKVPYYLLFYPDTEDLTLYRRGARKYVSVKPNGEERYPIEELELELGLVAGWVRYWFRGELLPLPADLQHELNRVKKVMEEQKRRLGEQEQRLGEQEQRIAEQERQLVLQGRQLDDERKAREALERELAHLRAQSGPPSQGTP
jgi:Uma2 family endonuclease